MDLDIQEVGESKAHIHRRSNLKTALCGYEIEPDFHFHPYQDRAELNGKVEFCATCELIVSLEP